MPKAEDQTRGRALRPRAAGVLRRPSIPRVPTIESDFRRRWRRWVKTERVLASRSPSLSLSGNMAGAEEAASFGSHLNGDLDPDDREEGASSTAEEAAKKKRRKKKKGKGTVSGKRSHVLFFRGPCQELGPGTGGRAPGTRNHGLR